MTVSSFMINERQIFIKQIFGYPQNQTMVNQLEQSSDEFSFYDGNKAIMYPIIIMK